jgi:hypothetical protein
MTGWIVQVCKKLCFVARHTTGLDNLLRGRSPLCQLQGEVVAAGRGARRGCPRCVPRGWPPARPAAASAAAMCGFPRTCAPCRGGRNAASCRRPTRSTAAQWPALRRAPRRRPIRSVQTACSSSCPREMQECRQTGATRGSSRKHATGAGTGLPKERRRRASSAPCDARHGSEPETAAAEADADASSSSPASTNSTTRRLTLRPSAVSLGATGRYSP